MSAIQNLDGRGFYDCDFINYNSGALAFGTGATAAASGTKLAMVGTIWHPSRTGTFNVRKVHWRGGVTTVNAASVIRVSLQDLSATVGPPYQPDGSQDQFADTVGSSMVASGWNVSGALLSGGGTPDRACNHGDSLAVVWEYGVGGFTAADSFILSTLDVGATNPTPYGFGGKALINTAGTWALISNGPVGNLAFECDDGSFAFFLNNAALLAFGTTSIANNITARAAGNEFTVPTPLQIDRIGLVITSPNNSDNILKLFSGVSTLLASKTLDNDQVTAAGSASMAEMAFTPLTLAPGTTYRIAIEGNSTTACTTRWCDVDRNALLGSFWGGSNCIYTERDSGGTWTPNATRRALMSIGLSGAHDGAGGGGGGGGPLIAGRLIGRH